MYIRYSCGGMNTKMCVIPAMLLIICLLMYSSTVVCVCVNVLFLSITVGVEPTELVSVHSEIAPVLTFAF